MERTITHAVTGFRTQDGAGVNLVRVLGNTTVKEFDPILMLDSFDSKNKMAVPAYHSIKTSDIKEIKLENGRLRVLAGEYEGIQGYTSKYLPLDYYDIHLDAHASFIVKTDSARSVMAFTLLGDAHIGGEAVKEKTAVKLGPGDYVKIQAADQNAQVLLMSSKALSEPVVWGGPIVMNTREELNKAFDDLNKGTFLRDRIAY